MISSNYFNPYEPGIFGPIVESLLVKGDFYCLFADFADYLVKQEAVGELFKDQKSWTIKSILNTARSGKFSSDRTVKEYADGIWNVKPVKIANNGFL
jgi:glycogen phosphorylase